MNLLQVFRDAAAPVAKYRIINIYAGFQNCYGDLPWRVTLGGEYVRSFRTRAAAREYIKGQA